MMTKNPKLNQQASVWGANTYTHVHIIVHSNWKRRSGSNFGGQTGRSTRFGSQRWVGSTRREAVGGKFPFPRKKWFFFAWNGVLVNFERYFFINVGRQLALAYPSLNSVGLVPPFPCDLRAWVTVYGTHNTAQNCYDGCPSYPPRNRHFSGSVVAYCVGVAMIGNCLCAIRPKRATKKKNDKLKNRRECTHGSRILPMMTTRMM